MTSLANLAINASFGGLLQIPGGLTTSSVGLQDGNGNALPMSASSTGITITIASGTIDNTPIGNTTPSTGKFTNISATGTISGVGFSNYLAAPPAIGGTTPAAGTFTTLTASTINGGGFSTYLSSPPPIGNVAPNTGAFTTLSASSTISGTGFSAYLASPPAIGSTAANTGAFTTLSASSTVSGTGFSTYLGSPPPIGNTAANTGAFTTLSASSTVSGTGFSTWLTAQLTTPPPIGGTTPNTGAFTTLNATGNVTFSGTGYTQIQVGSTAQRPGTPAVGMIRYNNNTFQFEGYAGSTPSWLPVGGSVLSNDTATATPVYPLFANATSGTATTIYTGNANLLYTPATGEFAAQELNALNGLHVNNATIATSYTIAATNNAGSFGPVSVASGVTVTVSSGSVWTVV